MIAEITRPARFVANILDETLAGRTPPGTVQHLQGILDAHGWPDIPTMREQADQLRRLKDLPVTFDIDDTARVRGILCPCGHVCRNRATYGEHVKVLHSRKKANA
jgi:hypothetical protein